MIDASNPDPEVAGASAARAALASPAARVWRALRGVASLCRLDFDGHPAVGTGFVRHLVEEHGLADASHTYEQEWARRAQSARRPGDENVQRFQVCVSSHHRSRRAACAWRVGIQSFPHVTYYNLVY